MAWNEMARSGTYLVCFRLGKKKFKRSLETNDKKQADILTRSLERTIGDVERGRLIVPENCDIVSFLLSDGRVTERLTIPEQVTVKDLFDAYFNELPEGCLEQSTIDGMKIHRTQLQNHLSSSFPIQNLSREHLQEYIGKRSMAKGRRGKLSAATIKKEIVTLRTVWNWGKGKYVEGPFPNRGLKYPKTTEKPSFMSFAEVEELTKSKADDELWESVYLTVEELEALLAHIEKAALLPFVYPMFVFAAHTGARRSEIMRARVADVDMKNRWVTIHERKRSHDKKTTRRVPISDKLHEVLKMWLVQHPGGQTLFCHSGFVAHSKKRSESTGHKWKGRATTVAARNATVKKRELPATAALTKDEMRGYFKSALAGTKWAKIRGWHAFRHSFVSALATNGVDQRIIDEFVSHSTEEQRRRYRHLFSSNTKKAIADVFGKPTDRAADPRS